MVAKGVFSFFFFLLYLSWTMYNHLELSVFSGMRRERLIFKYSAGQVNCM